MGFPHQFTARQYGPCVTYPECSMVLLHNELVNVTLISVQKSARMYGADVPGINENEQL